MRRYLLLGVGLALASCATQKALPHYSAAEQQAQRESITWWQAEPTKPDSTSGPRVEPNSQADLIRRMFDGHPPVVQVEVEAAPDSLRFVKVPQKQSWLKRLFPVKHQGAAPQSVASTSQIPRKCKGCTFIVGDNTTIAGKKATVAAGDGAAVVVAAKKAGPVVLADSAAQVQLALAQRGPAQAGDGNSAPTQEPGDWRAMLAKPAGEVAATALVLALVAGLCIGIYAWRKKKAAQNLV